MPLRKILLRIMLGSLAVSAVVGAVAVLSATDFSARILGTLITTAVAAALMIPTSLLVDKEKNRPAGLLGMAILLAEFLFTLFLIWDFHEFFSGHYFWEELAITMVLLFTCGVPAMLFLRLARSDRFAVTGWTGLTVAILVFVLFMIATWMPNTRFWNNDEWYQSAWSLAGFGLLIAFCLAGLPIRPPASAPSRPWRWIGVGASALALIILLVHFWRQTGGPAGVFAGIVSIAIVIAHAILCLLCPLTPGQRWVRRVAIGAMIASAACATAAAFLSDYSLTVETEFAGRLAGAAGIIAACASLALLILARINRKIDIIPVLSEIKQLTLICPGCQKKQLVTLPDATCPSCYLSFKIQVIEPRCPKCDYLLFMLQSDRCPECGQPIGASPASPTAPE